MSYLEDHYNEIFKKYSTEELLEDIRNYQLGGQANQSSESFL